MEELNLLEKLERVKAPPGFEQRVKIMLRERKEKKRLMIRGFRYSFAAGLALLLVFFSVLGIDIFQKKGSVALTLQKGESLETREYIPITEVVNYSSEIKNLASESGVIYILEEVSDDFREEIKY